MEQNLELLIIILPLIFLGGFIDAIAGGGSIITMSAFLLTGVPIHYALGTNKLQTLGGTVVATTTYVYHNHYKKEYILFSVIGAIVGSILGSNIALALNPQILNLVVVFALPIVAFIMLTNKKPTFKLETLTFSKMSTVVFLIGFICGIYDGMIGPGTGTFLIIAFSMCGLSFLDANGNAKIINTITNVVSMILFISAGKAILWIAIPAFVVNSIANYLGSKLAINNGDKVIKPVIILVLALLFIKMGIDVLNHFTL